MKTNSQPLFRSAAAVALSALFLADADVTQHVLQLTHVARPRQTRQSGIGFRVKLLGFHTQLTGGHLQEMARQAGNIFPTLTQRRQMNADDVQTVE